MSFISFCRKHNVGRKIDWVQRNFITLLLAANLIMSVAAYRKANESAESSEEAYSAATDAASAARDAAEAAHSAVDAANDIARNMLYSGYR
ncbi:hypothetical protein [Humidesulfovibrio sp.]